MPLSTSWTPYPPAYGSVSRMPDAPTAPPTHRSASGLFARYAQGLMFAQLLTAAEVAAVIMSLSRESIGSGRTLLTEANFVLVVVLVVVGTVGTVAGAYWSIAPSLRWFAARTDPDDGQRRDAINLVRRQTVLLGVTWLVGGAVLIVANTDAGSGPLVLLVIGVLFGATSSVSTGLLFSQRIIRPIVAAANREFIGRPTAPGVVARLVMMWLVNSAAPSVAIATLVVCHAFGWFVPKTASVVIPIVVMTTVSVALGLRALILVARSISDPIGEVVDAMSEVERGDIGRTVDVYEQSEIGRLQNGFNRMVAGLTERERLRDLFGRYVGLDVARLAVEADEPRTGEEREVAVLFIDLTASTRLAVDRPPHEVADVLNAFFRIVAAAVDENRGFINKFQGDAALAVFGAPLRSDDAAADALQTARSLSEEMRTLPAVDFGIGVSAGAVFAGNIGAENRYEYTVVGDAVNEAARLADAAKTTAGRTLASGAAIDRAGPAVRDEWSADGEITLRGRADPTRIWVPRHQNDSHE